jgi:hypothetical protein
MKTTIITIQRSFIILGLTLAAVLASCGGLPDYARPRGGVQIDDPAMLSDAFTYRRRTRSDFRAEEPGHLSVLQPAVAAVVAGKSRSPAG